MGIIYEFKDCEILYDGECTPKINITIHEGEKIALVISRDIYEIAFLYFLFFIKKDYKGYAAYKDRPFDQLSEGEIKNILKQQIHASFHLPLISNLKLIENVYLPLLYHTKIPESELFKKAYDLLKIFQLEDKFNFLPAFLSNYEKKCGLIARAFMSDASLIYFSHIFDDTDKEKRDFLLSLIEKFHEMKRERATIMTFRQKMHIPDNFSFDKIIVLK